jgi:putative ATPase
LTALAIHANGDARVALNLLDQAVAALKADASGVRRLDQPALTGLIERRVLLYDKSGEEHYNLISALHKSMRNSDADASIYWLARMLEAGEDPMYVARRLVRFASEGHRQRGSARPRNHAGGERRGALSGHAGSEHRVGPGRDLPGGRAEEQRGLRRLRPGITRRHPGRRLARSFASSNAPTRLMKDVGYGEGYRYAHDEAEGVAEMSCLPEHLQERRYYEPTDRGIESRIKDALERAKKLRGPKDK